MAAVAMHGFVKLHQCMKEALESVSEDPLKGIKILGVTYVRFAVENSAHFRVMFGPEVANRERFPELEAIATAVMGLQADLITQCQQQGLIREAPNLELGLAAWTAMHGCASLLLAQQLPLDLSEEGYVTIVGECLMNGLLR